MWVLFLMNDKGEDFFRVADEETVRAEYERLLNDPAVECVGIAPIAEGSEPHWSDPEFG